MSRPNTSHNQHNNPIPYDQDGKLSMSHLDSFFDGNGKAIPTNPASERITINVNVDDSNNSKSDKVLKTEIDVDGELIRHESLMTEMHADEDDQDDENIELLRTLLNDEDECGMNNGNLMDQLDDQV